MTLIPPDRTPSRSGSLGDLLRVLEATGLRLLSSPLGRDLAVSRTVLFEPRGRLEPTSKGILLGVGVTPSPTEGRRLLEAAAEHGFTAVVVKTYGDDPSPLVPEADGRGIALLVVHDDVAWLSLDALLNNALVSATQRADSLSSVAVGDLFSLAEAVADTVGGATAIEDYSQRILAYSSRGEHPIDDERREGILGRQVPDLPENAAQYRRLYRSEAPCWYPATDTGLARLAIAVRAGTELLGSIWVVDAGTGRDEHTDTVLRGAASVAALHLLRARSSEDLARQQRSEAARRLLEGSGDPVDAATALGLETSGPYAVLVLAPDRLDGTLAVVAERLLPLVALHAEARLGHTGAALVDGAVHVVAAGPRVDSGSTLTTVVDEIIAAAGSALRLRLLAGVGPVVRRPEQVPAARAEGERVVALLRRHPHLGRSATSTLVSDQLALAALADLVARDARLITARARSILDHDVRHDTHYARLLRIHLDRGREVGRTAEALGVHANTVRYRLRRAVDLFDLDLSAADQVLPLWLALVSLTSETDEGRADTPPDRLDR